MKKKLALLLWGLTTSAGAFVPLYDRFQTPPDPAVMPVHGPIKPRALVVAEPLVAGPLDGHQSAAATGFHTTVVLWGKEWNKRQFSADKINGLESFYEGYSNSSYAHLIDEYLSSSGTARTAQIIYSGHLIESRSELHPKSEFLDDVSVQLEIYRLISSNRLDFSPFANYYVVYTTQKPPVGGACSIHGTSYYYDYGNVFNYALIYNLDGVDQCDVKDRMTGHSQGLAALANVSARSLSSLQTDWDFRGYYDKFGNEVDDKCAWTFNVPYVTFTNGSIWKLQGLWSNAAYEAGTGYPNAGGERGCVDGR